MAFHAVSATAHVSLGRKTLQKVKPLSRVVSYSQRGRRNFIWSTVMKRRNNAGIHSKHSSLAWNSCLTLHKRHWPCDGDRQLWSPDQWMCHLNKSHGLKGRFHDGLLGALVKISCPRRKMPECAPLNDILSWTFIFIFLISTYTPLFRLLW